MSDCHTEDFPPGWMFKGSAHSRAYTTKSIAAYEEPIMRVFHDPEGDWQFHGAGESSPESGVLFCLHCIVRRDPCVTELADLPINWAAWRDEPTGPWHREPYERATEA